MERRKLPAGIPTFSQVREEGYYYVDRIAHARRIADGAGKRPRSGRLHSPPVTSSSPSSPGVTWSPPERPLNDVLPRSPGARRNHPAHRAQAGMRLYFGYTRAFAGGTMVTRVQKWGNSQGPPHCEIPARGSRHPCGRSGSYLDPGPAPRRSNRRPPCADDMICRRWLPTCQTTTESRKRTGVRPSARKRGSECPGTSPRKGTSW